MSVVVGDQQRSSTAGGRSRGGVVGTASHNSSAPAPARCGETAADSSTFSPLASAATEALYQGILGWYEKFSPATPQAGRESIAAFNSHQLPKRFATMMRPMPSDWLAQFDQQQSPQILDIGCGYGGIAMHMALKFPTGYVTAVDVTDHYYYVGREAAQQASVRNVVFRQGNMLQAEATGHYDVVVLCNVLNYMTSRADLARCCQLAFDALKPGGFLLLYTPQRAVWREPFTKLPLLHLLPRKLQSYIARRTGRRSTMDDIRLPGCGELVRILRRRGASDVHAFPRKLSQRLRYSHVSICTKKQK